MRNILYRGKRLDNEEWAEGNLFIPDKVTRTDVPTEILIGTNIVRISYEVDSSTVGQYTGLTDKNGNKIFEGDIISGCFRSNHSKQIFCVIFDDGMFLFDNTYVKVPKYEIYSMEVIGNSFDNPELLEGGDTIATQEERI